MRDWMKYTLINSMVGGIFFILSIWHLVYLGGGLDPSFAEDHPLLTSNILFKSSVIICLLWISFEIYLIIKKNWDSESKFTFYCVVV